jgi:hypothetical protein
MGMIPPPTPPAIVAGCSVVRHDGAQRTTSAVLNAAVSAVVPYPVANVGNAAAQSAADATVWTELQAELENAGVNTIVGVRLGVKLEDGSFKFLDVPVTIAPSGDATVKEKLAQGAVQMDVNYCSVLRVNFADGTSWYAPAPSPAP